MHINQGDKRESKNKEQKKEFVIGLHTTSGKKAFAMRIPSIP
jgi:hypothetical protein